MRRCTWNGLEYELPEPPVIPAEDFERSDGTIVRGLGWWRQRAETLRGIVEAIRSGRGWTPVQECSICRLTGQRPPTDGCQEHHPYLDAIPSPWQVRARLEMARFVAVTTGNGTGKSYDTADLLVFLCTLVPGAWWLAEERLPWLPMLPWPHAAPDPDYRWWLVGPKRSALEAGPCRYIRRLVEGTGWLRAEPAIISAAGGRRYTERFEIGYGTVWVKSQEQEKEEFGAASIHGAVEDEELKGEAGDAIRTEILGRFRQTRGRYWFKATAVDSATRAADSWIVNKVIKPCLMGRADPSRYAAFQVSTHENVHLTEQQRADHDALFRDPVTGEAGDWYRVRVLGEVVGVNIASVLEPSALRFMHGRAYPPRFTGRLSDASAWAFKDGHRSVPAWSRGPTEPLKPSFVLEAGGPLRVWEHPEPSHRYIIGADVGAGVIGGNPTAVWVYDRDTGRFVALWWSGSHGPVTVADEMIRLGWYYNRAWICVELSPVAVATASHLAGMDGAGPRYEWLYHHVVPGRYETHQGALPGYPALAREQQFMLDTINTALRPERLSDPTTIPIHIPCVDTLEEMLSIRRDANTGKVEYPQQDVGSVRTHCDRAVAIGMCLVAHLTCPMEPRVEDAPSERNELVRLAHEDRDWLRDQGRTAATQPLTAGTDFQEWEGGWGPAAAESDALHWSQE